MGGGGELCGEAWGQGPLGTPLRSCWEATGLQLGSKSGLGEQPGDERLELETGPY